MKEIKIEWLDASQFRILKAIIILGPTDGCDVELGRIFYKRQLSNSYCLKESDDRGERELSSLDKCIVGFPKQDRYPVDRVDELILATVRNQFARSITRSETFLHAMDAQRLDALKQANVVQCRMYFTLGLWSLDEVYDRPEGAGIGYAMDINIYSFCESLKFQNRVFIGKFDHGDRSWLQRLQQVEFE